MVPARRNGWDKSGRLRMASLNNFSSLCGIGLSLAVLSCGAKDKEQKWPRAKKLIQEVVAVWARALLVCI